MNKHLPTFVVTGVMGLSCAAMASAADHDVVANLSVAKVSARGDGMQALEPVRKTRPGDILEYRITYRNKGREAARGVVGTLTVPVHRMSYVPHSGLPGVLEASLDGKTFAPAPLMRLVAHDDGRVEMQPVAPSEYRYLRWQLGDMPARSTITVSARMHIDEVPVVLVTNAVR
jgi:uncharacterized repeat protein (TIGR01451 family)